MKAYRVQSTGPSFHTAWSFRRFILGCLLVAGLSASCGEAQPASKSTLRVEDMRGVVAAEKAAQPTASAKAATEARVTPPAAIVNGRAIPWEEVRAGLSEAAGAQVLQETVLDHILSDQIASKGITISPSDIDAERALLIQQITKDARATSPDDAERLLETVRRSRGLGETRFARLLERNARLRHLVAPTVQVTNDEVGLAFRMLHGPKRRVRVIVTTTQQRAAGLREQILFDQGHAAYPADRVRSNFIAAAAEESIDPSAARGGQIDPFSPEDEQYPASLRDAAAAIKVGEVSAVLPVDKGFALAFLEEIVPGDGVKLEDVSGQISAEVRRRRERLEMDKLARRLIQTATVAVPDKSLDWAWRGRQGIER